MNKRLSSARSLQTIDAAILQSAIAASRGALIITDNLQPNNPIIYSNQAFETLTGYSHTEIIGHNCRFLQGPDTSKKDIAKLHKAVQTGSSLRLVIKNYRKDGTPFWNDLLLSPITAVDGQTTHFIGTQLDATSQVETSQALKQKSTQLEKSIHAIERKRFQHDLDEARAQTILLSQQKRQLLELTRAKDEFISLASHQLRTPATAVKQYLGMIIEGHMGDIDEHIFKLLSTAYSSNERQLTVINDLLKTAQLDANSFRLKPHPEDVSDIVASAVQAFLPSLEMRQQNIVFNNPQPHIANVDRSEFSLVIENLIENASKYTPHGKTIIITVAKKAEFVVVNVRDEGVGISKTNVKRIFDKFTRIDNELSDTVSGSGLGLYWAKRIMRLHKGSISVKSELGVGSTFTVKVPTT